MFTIITPLQQQYTYAQASTNPLSLVRLNFDTGDFSQWIKQPGKPTTTINNCIEWDHPNNNNRLQIVRSPVKQGTHSLKVTLTQNAIVIPGTDVNGERAELKYWDSPRHVHLFKNG